MSKVEAVVEAVATRLSQPSTWAGLAAVAISLGVADHTWASISAAGAAIAGLVAIVLKEGNDA